MFVYKSDTTLQGVGGFQEFHQMEAVAGTTKYRSHIPCEYCTYCTYCAYCTYYDPITSQVTYLLFDRITSQTEQIYRGTNKVVYLIQGPPKFHEF